MKTSRTLLIAATVLLGSPALAQSGPTVRIDGSSTVYPVTEAVAEEFQKAKRNAVKVTVGISGTGGGFKKLCRDELDLANASRPILEKEIADCAKAGVRFVELPIAFDALTVVVNPKNTFLTQITVDELKRLWEPAAQGKIVRWNQINPAWPDQPIKLFGPGADSGTFDYFTETVVGKAKASRGDFTASEDDNVLVQGVSRDLGALGYFGYAYFAENSKRLKALPVVGKSGKPVAPSLDTVINGTYQPLARPIFIYVNEKALKRAEVREFTEFYLKNASTLAKEVRYVPLPPRAYELGLKNLARGKLGSVFSGHSEAGITIEQLLARESKP